MYMYMSASLISHIMFYIRFYTYDLISLILGCVCSSCTCAPSSLLSQIRVSLGRSSPSRSSRPTFRRWGGLLHPKTAVPPLDGGDPLTPLLMEQQSGATLRAPCGFSLKPAEPHQSCAHPSSVTQVSREPRLVLGPHSWRAFLPCLVLHLNRIGYIECSSLFCMRFKELTHTHTHPCLNMQWTCVITCVISDSLF